MAGIHFHQQGHFIGFQRSDRDVVIEYDPKTHTIGAGVIRRDEPHWSRLDDLILSRRRDARFPTRTPLDRSSVEATVRWWAAGLRDIASDVL
jgi:hypothetical protein